MMTKFLRIIRFGFQDFSRNKGLSLQVIFIMSVAVLALSSLLIFREISSFMIDEVEKKVDISVYFKENVSEESILNVEEELTKLTDKVKDVEYVSRESAMEIFIETHTDDPLYLEALDEVGDNPFLASLNIRAINSTYYEKISEFLNEDPFRDLVDKISYYKNREVIEKLFSLTEKLKSAGLYISVFLMILVFFITFNTVKLTIFAVKDEISTMKIVGASNWFIRIPFLVQGLLYAVISIIIINLLLFLLFTFFSPDLENWLLGFNTLEYFNSYFIKLLGYQLLFSILVSIISSYFATRAYLKV